jgi:serine/threonine-protein kinase
MSPEQMRSARDVDATTDIWALGVILFELLTGKAPFVGDNMPELVLKIASSPPESMRSLLPTLPARLEQVVLKCLEKDRTKRYRNVAELAAALVEFGPKRARVSAERIARIIEASGLSRDEFAAPSSSKGDPAKWGKEAEDAQSGRSHQRATVKRVVIGLSFALVAGIAVLAYLVSTSQLAETAVTPPETSATPTSSSRARSSPPPADPPAIEAGEQRVPPPGSPVPAAPKTVGPPRSTRTKSPPAASSSVPPGAMPSSLPPATPPRTGSAYDERK